MIETKIKLDALRWREDNPNRMDPDKLEALTNLIREVGFFQPILVREMEDGGHEIIDGHHRVKAMLANDRTEIDAKVIELGDPEHDKADLLQIAMNNLRGRLDLHDTGLAFADMIEEGIDPELLTLSGFSRDEIDDLVSATSLDPDDVMTGASLPDSSQDDDDAPAKPFHLEIEFTDKAEFQAAKKALKKAAGKGNPLSTGLLSLIGAQ